MFTYFSVCSGIGGFDLDFHPLTRKLINFANQPVEKISRKKEFGDNSMSDQLESFFYYDTWISIDGLMDINKELLKRGNKKDLELSELIQKEIENGT